MIPIWPLLVYFPLTPDENKEQPYENELETTNQLSLSLRLNAPSRNAKGFFGM